VAAAFSRETGLPLWMLDDRVPLHLEDARRWVAARVLGQPEAVDLVVSLLGRFHKLIRSERDEQFGGQWLWVLLQNKK
jgi:ATP-dependent Clp protease ATP-binding subunit ClpA